METKTGEEQKPQKQFNPVEKGIRVSVFAVLAAIGFIARHGSAPFHWVSKHVHKLVDDHPMMQNKHARLYISAALGACVISLIVLIEHTIGHTDSVALKCGTEITKAGAACPVWEVISLIVRVAPKP